MKLFRLVAILMLTALTSHLHAYSGNERSEFANKFTVMKKLAASCRSTNEKTSVAALNALREVFFRNSENYSLPVTSGQAASDSFLSLCERMNSDVDKVYTGIRNLENSLKVSDPYDISDKYLNEILRFLVISEITMILNDQNFFTVRDKILDDIQKSRQFILSAMYVPPAGAENSDLIVLDRLSNLVDLAGYIYNEQVQWMMNCSFSVQSLDVTSYSIAGDSVFKGFATNRPPRLYIPGNRDDYTLSGGSR